MSTVVELDKELDMISLTIRKLAAEKKLELLRQELESARSEKDKFVKRRLNELDDLEEGREKRTSSEELELGFEY